MKIQLTAIFLAGVYGGADAQACDGSEPEKWYQSGNAGDWSNGYCRFERQCGGNFGGGYSTNLACCKGAFGGQMSGKCLSLLAAPPTTSPTMSGGLTNFWYPDYAKAWPDAGCLNTLPLPYNNPNDRPQYETQLACCKGAYGGQSSGKCLSQLASPPTTSPTMAGGMAGFWYPDYESAWSDAGCKNEMPLPFNKGDRPEYDTQLACCKAAYGGQTSGKCLSQLASPPTTSPTMAGGLGLLWYPDYSSAWSDAGCKNDVPLPFSANSRPTYDTQLACCKAAYGGQSSGKCLSQLASPPTTSPTMAGGLGLEWYPDYTTAWSDAGCTNAVPKPFNDGDRPTYDTQIACCKAAYGGQTSGKCLSQLASPPTTSPTTTGNVGSDYYPDYTKAWPSGVCINSLPVPSGRPTYSTQSSCCSGAYGGQTSMACLCDADPCYSCRCGSTTFLTNANCSATFVSNCSR